MKLGIKLKTWSICGLSLISAAGPVSQVSAFEPGASFASAPGVTLSRPLGAMPPPGLYATDIISYGQQTLPTAMTQTPAGPGSIRTSTPTQTPVLAWITPWTLLGANTGLVVVQPMASIDSFGTVDVPGVGATQVNAHQGGLRPTEIIGALSWNLGNGWFVGPYFGMFVPDAPTYGPNGLSNLMGEPFVTFEPGLAVSYLANDWNLTLTTWSDVSTTNPKSGVLNGTSVDFDLTLARHFGKFNFGFVGDFAFQINKDSGGNLTNYLATIANPTPINYCGPLPTGFLPTCTRASVGQVGALIGYNFGPINVDFNIMKDIFDHGQGGVPGGWRAWAVVSTRLYGEDPPAPSLKITKP